MKNNSLINLMGLLLLSLRPKVMLTSPPAEIPQKMKLLNIINYAIRSQTFLKFRIRKLFINYGLFNIKNNFIDRTKIYICKNI